VSNLLLTKDRLFKKEGGFTLIEIVLVLAIAGLLLVIVFLAVSGAQKSRRDTQRKNDLSRLASQLESYASNNNGAYPANQAALSAAAFTTYLPSNFTDPATGANYGFGTVAAGGTAGTIQYNLGGTACDGSGLSGRQYRVQMTLEQGVACRDNK
jgi:prepilin-type N-terminal cleavage/methylation domain-containing protein